MRGIQKSLLRSASVIALLVGASMLLSSEASAQINIPGIVFGSMGYGSYHRDRHGGPDPAAGEPPAQPDQTVNTEAPQTDTAADTTPVPTTPPAQSSAGVPTFSPSR